MSDDGRFVFFRSPVGLTPRALNDVPVSGQHQGLAENVYEWEAQGEGCAAATGCVFLISDGLDDAEGHGSAAVTTPSAVELLGTDRSGDNVFFATVDQLVGQDDDTQLDYYDARVDGGFPRPVEEVPCQTGGGAGGVSGESCRGTGTVASVFGPVVSEVLTSSGNVVCVPGVASAGCVVIPVKKAVVLTRAQLLAKALAVCRKRDAGRSAGRRRKRVACETLARHRYGVHVAKKAKRAGKRGKKSSGGRGR